VLDLRQGLVDELVAHAAEADPREACGVLVGPAQECRFVSESCDSPLARSRIFIGALKSHQAAPPRSNCAESRRDLVRTAATL